MVSDAYDQLRDPRRRAMYDRSHPIARSPAAGTPGGSVSYAAPGSQHIVLGRSARGLNEVCCGLLDFSTRPLIDWRCGNGEPVDP
jgi:hypothetical protein